jgi:hypothetical protein
MDDIEKDRTQRDARRAVAGRRTVGSARSDHAILRHLGVELYRERHRSVSPADGRDDEAEATTDGSEKSDDRSPER